MPRSRSRSMESRTWARIDRASMVRVISRMRSASVDLPWSMCAMIEKLRMRSWSMPALQRRARRNRLAVATGAPAALRSGQRDAVAALRLDPVERTVRAADERPVGLAVDGHRDADGGRQPQAGAGDRLAQALARLERLAIVGDGDQG